MKKTQLFLALLLFAVFSVKAQQLLTVAEKSDFQTTSAYSDVRDFINELLKTSPFIKSENIAVSTEGKEIPLMIIANPLPKSAADLKNGKRIVVYFQANIHAGEVEGKEATLMLARDLLKDPKSEILKNVIVLICPILNIDGNDKISTKNRTNQNGPVNGVGVRYNGQFLDLNRDAMKLETPEISSVVSKILNVWNPAVTVDCHTTDGSYHEEPVTFTWMMNPNGSRNLINFMRDKMMPEVHAQLLDNYKVDNIFYGEFMERLDLDKGWISEASEPRYLVNYIGVRNRLAILNENYVYADFKTRVQGCYFLLRTILDFSSANKKDILKLLQSADEQAVNRNFEASADSFAIEYQGVPTPEKITIKAFEADTVPGVQGYWRYKQSDRKRTVTVPYIADFFPTKCIKMPFAYILTIPDKDVLNNLKAHGIVVERLQNNLVAKVERFKINELKGSERLNQGHYTQTVKGEFILEEKEFPAGTYFIKTGQKLGNLAACLLEPQSDDGLLLWNYFDKYLVPQWGGDYFAYPVYRMMEKTAF